MGTGFPPARSNGQVVAFFDASAGEGRSDKIMRKIAHDPEKWEPVSG
jgi:hypothetical protein